MSTRIVDAGVAVKWVVAEEGSERALALLESDHELLAPDWLLVECANVLWKRVRRGDLTAAEAAVRMRVLERLDACLRPARPLARRAHDLSITLRHPAYDMIYLALAEQEQAVMVTADERLARAVTGTRWAPLVELL